MFMRLFFFLLLAQPCAAADLPGIPQFIDEMVSKYGYQRDELVQIFERAQHLPAVINAMSLPSTAKPWIEYRANFLDDKRIKEGLKFWQQHQQTLSWAEWEYGVPQEIMVAIIGVETMYGRNAGRHNTLDALTTLAFDYPRRAVFFRSELEHYLELAREQEWDIFKVKSSYAGALGIPQFMPSSYLNYAEDYNNDNQIDLLNDPVDAIGSVGNYFKRHGWQSGEPVAVLANVGEKALAGDLKALRNLASWADEDVTPAVKIETLVVKIETLVKKESPEIETPEVEIDTSAKLLDFTVANGKEYWLTFNNFRVITRYNNSNFYAMSVYQLADVLRNTRKLESENHAAPGEIK